jgi:hypothetical protein
MVYFVLAMDLFAPAPYQEVMGRLAGGLRPAGLWGDQPLPSRPSISQARERLGPAPLFALHRAVTRSLVQEQALGSHWRGLRLTHLEQEAIDLPERASPVVRQQVVAVVDSAGGTVRDLAVGTDGPNTVPLGSVGRGTLLTVHGKPLSPGDVEALTAAGVALLWRLPDGHRARVTRGPLLPDGSFLARLGGLGLRVLGPGIFTSLLDAQRAPRAELLAILARTAATPGALREVLPGADRDKGPLTSRTFDGIRQELWGRLLVHHAIRQFTRHVRAPQEWRESVHVPEFAR